VVVAVIPTVVVVVAVIPTVVVVVVATVIVFATVVLTLVAVVVSWVSGLAPLATEMTIPKLAPRLSALGTPLRVRVAAAGLCYNTDTHICGSRIPARAGRPVCSPGARWSPCRFRDVLDHRWRRCVVPLSVRSVWSHGVGSRASGDGHVVGTAVSASAVPLARLTLLVSVGVLRAAR
jgi:hypothetical protein